MSVFLTHKQARSLEYTIDFKRGKSYKCIKTIILVDLINLHAVKFMYAKNNYYLPCNSGLEISQFNLISIDSMFTEQ